MRKIYERCFYRVPPGGEFCILYGSIGHGDVFFTSPVPRVVPFLFHGLLWGGKKAGSKISGKHAGDLYPFIGGKSSI